MKFLASDDSIGYKVHLLICSMLSIVREFRSRILCETNLGPTERFLDLLRQRWTGLDKTIRITGEWFFTWSPVRLRTADCRRQNQDNSG